MNVLLVSIMLDMKIIKERYMKKFFRSMTFFVGVILLIIVIICFIPRNNTSETFLKLDYGDNFVFTMLRLGKPTSVSEGGNGTLFCKYEIEDGSSVYVSFNNKLLYLNGAEMVKENEEAQKYVIKKENRKTKLLSILENSIIGDFTYAIKNLLMYIICAIGDVLVFASF